MQYHDNNTKWDPKSSSYKKIKANNTKWDPKSSSYKKLKANNTKWDPKSSSYKKLKAKLKPNPNSIYEFEVMFWGKNRFYIILFCCNIDDLSYITFMQLILILMFWYLPLTLSLSCMLQEVAMEFEKARPRSYLFT